MKPVYNGKIANVMYVLDNPSVYSSDVTLLIVDVKNNLHGDFNVVFNSATTAAADINAALAKGDVTVANLPASSVSIPAGKTLTVTGSTTDDAINAITAVNGAKLVLVAGSSTASSTYTAGTYTYNGSTWTK